MNPSFQAIVARLQKSPKPCFGTGVFGTRVLETCVLETVEKKPKSLKGLGSTVRRVWLEGAISGGAEFVRKRR